jgi:hypothetical protein
MADPSLYRESSTKGAGYKARLEALEQELPRCINGGKNMRRCRGNEDFVEFTYYCSLRIIKIMNKFCLKHSNDEYSALTNYFT